jgi:hypothetical protein
MENKKSLNKSRFTEGQIYTILFNNPLTGFPPSARQPDEFVKQNGLFFFPCFLIAGFIFPRYCLFFFHV